MNYFFKTQIFKYNKFKNFITNIYGLNNAKLEGFCKKYGFRFFIKTSNIFKTISFKILEKNIIKSLSHYKFGNSLYNYQIKLLTKEKKIGSYKGIRYTHFLPCRGQRTRTNARTVKIKNLFREKRRKFRRKNDKIVRSKQLLKKSLLKITNLNELDLDLKKNFELKNNFVDWNLFKYAYKKRMYSILATTINKETSITSKQYLKKKKFKKLKKSIQYKFLRFKFCNFYKKIKFNNYTTKKRIFNIYKLNFSLYLLTKILAIFHLRSSTFLINIEKNTVSFNKLVWIRKRTNMLLLNYIRFNFLSFFPSIIYLYNMSNTLGNHWKNIAKKFTKFK